MVIKSVRWFIRKTSWRVGYTINDSDNSSSTPFGNDPRELLYLNDLPYSVQYLPFEFGIGMRFFPFKNPIYHPFILALKQAKNDPERDNVAFSILKKYNELLHLTTANDFLGLNADQACFPDHYHPFEFCYPWTTSTPQETKKIYLENVNNENIRHGLSTVESLELKNASNEKIRIEVRRLLDLRAKIEAEGFKPNISDSLGCFVLINGDRFRWYVHGGQHRAAVLMSMGYDKVPIHVRRVIRREDAKFWPNVQRGLFSREQALTVFDALFSRQTPDITGHWINYVNANYNMINSSYV